MDASKASKNDDAKDPALTSVTRLCTSPFIPLLAVPAARPCRLGRPYQQERDVGGGEAVVGRAPPGVGERGMVG